MDTGGEPVGPENGASIAGLGPVETRALATREATFAQVGYGEAGGRADGAPLLVARALALECPVAIEINGIAFAVMMASPIAVEDFVTGFLMAEGLARADQIGAIALHRVEEGAWGEGLVARVALPAECLGPVLDRARRRIGDSSCGICGLDGIETALRPLPQVVSTLRLRRAAVARALTALRG
ncbi:formate dehydrogenase accessory sulfurtransferase FdhD, partial [Novosphingobium sp. 1949]